MKRLGLVLCFLALAAGYGFSQTTHANYARGFVDTVYVQNINGTEMLLVLLKKGTVQFSGDSSSIELGACSQQGGFAIDTTSPFYKDFLSVALTLWSTQQECNIAVEGNSNPYGYNYIRVICGFQDGGNQVWHS